MDEVIAELESDKATFELTAEKAGILKTIAKEGDTIPVGGVVCSIEEAGSAPAAAPQAVAASAAPAPVAEKAPAPVAPARQQPKQKPLKLKYRLLVNPSPRLLYRAG